MVICQQEVFTVKRAKGPHKIISDFKQLVIHELSVCLRCGSLVDAEFVVLRNHLDAEALRALAVGFGWERGAYVGFLGKLKETFGFGFHFL